jgi:hypothetical protein
MDAVVQVLVKDPNTTIVAECPKLITANEVESKCTSAFQFLFSQPWKSRCGRLGIRFISIAAI